jgi:hypothetical protein
MSEVFTNQNLSRLSNSIMFRCEFDWEETRMAQVFRSLVIVIICTCLFAVQPVAGQEKSDKIDWQSDLAVLERELPKSHLNAFHTLSAAQFHKMVKELAARSANATDRQMLAGLMEITAAIGDSHSGIHSLPAKLRFSIVPISLYVFADGLGVIAAAPEYRDIVGARVISINGHASADVVRHMKLLTEGTNDSTRLAFVPTRLMRPELLYYEGLAATPDQYELVVEKDGQTLKRKLAVLGRKADGSPITGGFSIQPLPAANSDWLSAAPEVRPLWLQAINKHFWYSEIPEQNALYVQDNLVLNEDNGQTFNSFFQEVFEKIGSRGYKTVILDLRLNGGGNNMLFQSLKETFKSLPVFQTKGSFFVITGRLTQSAAQNFTTFLERNTKAIFVGEPTGERPNHYGDAEAITLPSSGIEINLSRKYWEDSQPGDPRLWTAPAIQAPLTLRLFRDGSDPALEAIWRYRRTRSEGRSQRSEVGGQRSEVGQRSEGRSQRSEVRNRKS